MLYDKSTGFLDHFPRTIFPCSVVDPDVVQSSLGPIRIFFLLPIQIPPTSLDLQYRYLLIQHGILHLL